MTNIINVAKSAALKAGEYLRSNFQNVKVSQKSSTFDLITNCDIQAQKIIFDCIEQAFPSHSFLGEEDDNRADIKSRDLWIIDPIDGTNNFAHGIPHFSISIAYCNQGEVLVGVVYDPFRDEMFWAAKGEGSYLNDTKISVSSCDSLTKAIIATGFYYDRGNLMDRTLDSMRKLFIYPIQGIRRNGSAALDIAWVACGRFDGFFEYQLSVWDFAAGILISKEAGAVISQCNGSVNDLNNKNIMVSNKDIYDNFLEIIRMDI